MKKRTGVSLLELLVVIAIIGILSTVGFQSFRVATRKSRVNEAATQISADLQRVRTASQRNNQNASLSIASANASSYTLTISGASRQRSLPEGTRVTPATVPLSIDYEAPFGVVKPSAGSRITVSSTDSSISSRYVKVIGVTGKVYVSANQ